MSAFNILEQSSYNRLAIGKCQHPQDWYHYMQCTKNQALSGKQQGTGKVSTLKQSSHIFSILQPAPTP